MLNESQIIDLTRSVIKSMLIFKLTAGIQKYVMSKTHREFREFEEETAITNPIKGTGLLADRANILTTTRKGGRKFYLDNLDVGSHELGEHIGTYPLATASASFVLTQMEAFGDDVVGIVNPGVLDSSRSWYHDIKDRHDFRDSVQAQKEREAFARYFAAD